MHHTLTLLCILALPLITVHAAPPPSAEKLPVADAYHGVTITDDYRWLEDWSKPEVKAWSEAQNAHARGVLDALPSVPAIRARVTEVLSAQSVSYSSLKHNSGKLFAMTKQPPKQQPFLIVMDSAFHPDTARVLVDPNTMDSEGTTSIDWFIPSPDGKLVAVSLSKGGSESGDVHLYDVASAKPTGEVVPRVNGGTAGGSLAWTNDGKGFFYTRYPRAGERPEADMDFYMQVYFHPLGSPTSQDVYETGKDFPRIAEIQLDIDKETGAVLATIQKGDGGEFFHVLRAPEGGWTQVSQYSDRIVQAAFAPEKTLFLISRKDAPRGKVLRGSWTKPVTAAATVLPEGQDALVSDFWDPSVMVVTPSRLYLTYQLGGPSEIRVFSHDGADQRDPTQAPVSSVSGMTHLEGDDILFNMVSYVDPAAWYHFDGKTGATNKTALVSTSPVDFSDCEVVREFATSKDGTKVPVNIIRKKGLALDGSHPCMVTGYGGYGVNITPGYSAGDRVLIDQGFVLAEANIRGGGEFGDAWHRQGNLTRKQNVFDDFAAACRHVIDRKYTTSERLAIQGGSNGGLLMGAILTQHPGLAKAVVSHVGIYDMLRVELSANGAFNIPEFGTVKDEDQFKALRAYSPYHNVKEGVQYPSILFLTGANDPRVDPMQSRKMTARLQAAGAPALLRTSADSGHGGGTALSEKIEQAVDVDAFLFHHLGIKYQEKH